jgi:calcineurin-like phosphoesterase family protein
MNEVLIANWNLMVPRGSIVYHLGDFGFGNAQKIKSIVSRLNGEIRLVLGSHDKNCKGNKNLGFSRISDSTHITHIIDSRNKEINIFLNHYCHKVWPSSHRGWWHLFGHSHGGMDEYAIREGKLLDVGVDSHNFFPWSLEEVIAVMETRPLNFNDLKRNSWLEECEDGKPESYT